MGQFGSRGSNMLAGRKNRRAADAMRHVLRTVPPQLVADAGRQWFDSDSSLTTILPLQYQESLPVYAGPFFGDVDRLAKSPAQKTDTGGTAADDWVGDDLLLIRSMPIRSMLIRSMPIRMRLILRRHAMASDLTLRSCCQTAAGIVTICGSRFRIAAAVTPTLS
jgi:hypothetical protein